MPVTYQFDASAAIRKLNLATEQLRTGAPAVLRRGYEEAGEIGLKYERDRFDRLSSGGGEWAPLAPSTVRAKGNNRILIDTGDMRASLVRGGPNNVFRATANGVEFGTSDPKARRHQSGGGHLPRRIVIAPIPSDVKRRMTQAIERAVNQMFYIIFR